MLNRTTVKNVIFLGLFAFGVFLITKDISLSADILGILMMTIAAIRFI